MSSRRSRPADGRPRSVLRPSAIAVVLASTALALPGSVRQAAAASSYTPSQIRAAYGFNTLSATGTGTTIAIIDSYNDMTIRSDAAAFNTMYGLPQFGGTGGGTLTVVGQTLSTTTLPGADPTGDYGETALDVEYAHAIAPGANILLVQANGLDDASLVTAINNVKNDTKYNATVVSMSFGGSEYGGYTGSSASYNENSLTFNANSLNDNTFQQPASRATKVAFLASTGDDGTQSYPSESSYVIGVGGTSLTLNASNQRTSETVWNDAEGSTGTGVSAYEARPSYQTVAAAKYAGGRVNADVSYDGDPETGFYVYTGGKLYAGYGGTSISCPQWAALIALADQVRATNGLAPLSTNAALTMLYALYGTPFYSQAFYDVTSGTANGYAASLGYDAPSGLGTPIASFIVPYLGGSISIVPEPATAGAVALATTVLFARRRPRKA